MIFVSGVLFQNDYSDEESSDLVGLLEHPALVSASLSLKAAPEKKFSTSETSSEELTKSKHVYVFQREYATVDPTLVDWIGTDEATTCVGVAIRNRDNGITSVAHMDSPEIVEVGVSQMLSKLAAHKVDAEIDVHLIGGYEDTPPMLASQTRSRRKVEEGYSLPLCAKIIEVLGKSALKFHIQTLFVLGHNTKRDAEGNGYPIFTGLAIETMTGAITPATFDETTRCPDEIVRRIRLSASFEDPRCRGRLLDTYDTETDRFIIAPCPWNARMVRMASYLQQFTDSEVLQTCSTSPYAEAPDFVYNQRRFEHLNEYCLQTATEYWSSSEESAVKQWDYLIKHSDWKDVFQMGQPRVFNRDANGEWTIVEQEQ